MTTPDVPLLTFAEAMARPCPCGAVPGESCRSTYFGPISMDYLDQPVAIHVARIARPPHAEEHCQAPGCPNTPRSEWRGYCYRHAEHYRSRPQTAAWVGDGREIEPGPVVVAPITLRRRTPAEADAYFAGALAALRGVLAMSTCGPLNIDIQKQIDAYEVARRVSAGEEIG